MKTKLILASQSERRVKLLNKANIKFRQIVSHVDENTALKKPSAIVKKLAFKKALAVARKHPDYPVIGADTLVFCRGTILGKPANLKEAAAMLEFQNGNWQSVYSGVSMIWLNKNIFLSEYDVAKCKARKLGDKELIYFASKHMDKAGGYAVQDTDDIFIEKIKGRFDTIVGLPMNIVKRFVKGINNHV